MCLLVELKLGGHLALEVDADVGDAQDGSVDVEEMRLNQGPLLLSHNNPQCQVSCVFYK